MKQGVNGEEELEILSGYTNHNENLNMDNDPLLDSLEDSTEDVQFFAERYGLGHKTHLLQRAATLNIIGSTPQAPSSVIDADLKAHKREARRKWSQPLQMYLCIIATALGAMGQGWAQTGINGANLYFPKLFKIGSNSLHDTLIVGFINCGIYLSNGLLGAWLVAPLNDRLGRRGAVFAAALISLAFNIAGSMAQSWLQLLLCRLALGVGLGIISSTLNVFAAECAPAAIRGGLAVAWQMYCAFGIFIGFLTNMLVDNNPEAYGPLRWRLMLLAPALPMLPLLLLIFACPESPSWYVKHSDRYDLAFASFCRLRNTELQAAQELYTFYLRQKSLSKASERSSYFDTLVGLFTVPRVRRATLAAYSTMLAQQLCGINIIAFYSSTIFVEANFTTYAAEMASTIFGLVNFLGAFPAIWSMDVLGRRSLLLFTLPPMAISMAVAGFSFSISDENAKLRFGMTTSMIYLFCLLYSPGMGPVPAAYSAEVFPLSHRELGTSSAIAMTNLFASLLSLTFPWLLSTFGNQGSFLLYALLNVVAWILVFLFVPETKRRTLEELDEVFSVPTKSFIYYQIHEYAPWWTKKYLLRQKVADLSQLQSKNVGNYQAVEQDDD